MVFWWSIFALKSTPTLSGLSNNPLVVFHNSMSWLEFSWLVPQLSLLGFLVSLPSGGAGPSVLLHVASVSMWHLVLCVFSMWPLSTLDILWSAWVSKQRSWKWSGFLSAWGCKSPCSSGQSSCRPSSDSRVKGTGSTSYRGGRNVWGNLSHP